jgi:nucleoside-diphosphate-sugar epimerase
MDGPMLVTGASGVIGSYLLPVLDRAGCRVRVLVRDPRLLDQLLRSRLDVHVGDIRHRAVVRRAVEGADTVLHLAACAQPQTRERDAPLSAAVTRRGIGNHDSLAARGQNGWRPEHGCRTRLSECLFPGSPAGDFG